MGYWDYRGLSQGSKRVNGHLRCLGLSGFSVLGFRVLRFRVFGSRV